MRTRAAIATALLAVMCAPLRGSLATAEANMLPPPGFHHLHLNSVDPAAAIHFYTRLARAFIARINAEISRRWARTSAV